MIRFSVPFIALMLAFSGTAKLNLLVVGILPPTPRVNLKFKKQLLFRKNLLLKKFRLKANTFL